MTSPQLRAHFDAEISFGNGGGLQAQGFRLDLPEGAAVDSDAIGRLFVRQLGLLMTTGVSVTNLRIVEEPHKGSRDVSETAGRAGAGGTRGNGPDRRLIDLTHVISEGLVTYPGLPAPQITPYLTREASKAVYAEGTQFAMDLITMIGNTGTYLDSPFHRYEGGTDLAGLPLQSVADLPVSLVRFTDASERGISATALSATDIRGRAVLLHTGWDQHFGTPAYGDPAPYLTADGAAYLVAEGAALVGIDSVNIDDTQSGGVRPAHTQLLAAQIPVLEHLTNLAAVPANGGRLHAAPPPVRDFGTFPVRAYVVTG